MTASTSPSSPTSTLKGSKRNVRRGVQPQRLCLHARPRRPASCWLPRSTTRPSTGRRKSTWTSAARPMVVRWSLPPSPTFLNGQDVNTTDVCPAALGTKDEQPAAFSPLTKLFYVPTNHVCMDYEPFKVEYTAGQPYVGATLSMYPPQGREPTWATSLRGMLARARSSGPIRSSSPFGPALSPPLAASPATARSRATSSASIRRIGKELFKFKHAFRHHRQRVHLRTQGQAVHRRLLGRRRLGWHRPRGWPDQPDRWSGCCRWLRGSEPVHRSRWLADRVLAAIKSTSRSKDRRGATRAGLLVRDTLKFGRRVEA